MCPNFVGLIESFDGLTLSTNLRVPTTATTAQPLPTMLIQGGFPGGRSGGRLDAFFGIHTFVNAGYATGLGRGPLG